MPTDQPLNEWGRIVDKAWQDAAFKKRLLASPAVVLNEQGVKVAPAIEIRVVENTENLLHLTLPAQRHRGELADADLAGVAGGAVSVSLVKSLASVFGWSPKQVDRILGRGDVPYTGGGGDTGHPGDDGRE